MPYSSRDPRIGPNHSHCMCRSEPCREPPCYARHRAGRPSRSRRRKAGRQGRPEYIIISSKFGVRALRHTDQTTQDAMRHARVAKRFPGRGAVDVAVSDAHRAKAQMRVAKPSPPRGVGPWRQCMENYKNPPYARAINAPLHRGSEPCAASRGRRKSTTARRGEGALSSPSPPSNRKSKHTSHHLAQTQTLR